MRVHAPTLSVEGERISVSVGFESDREAIAPASSITIGFPRRLAGRLDLSATPWVPIAAVLAAALSEDVDLDAPADPVVVEAAAAATGLMASWWGWRAPRVRATAQPTDPAETGRGHGLFFTRGIDSWSSYLELQNDPAERSVTHLLSVFGVNPARTASVEASIRQRTKTVACALGVELIDIETDVRSLIDPHLPWEQSHGAVLLTCGLILAPVLDRLTIASSWTLDDSPPWGSHVDLDPLWHTSRVEVIHHLAALDRVEKATIIARDPLAMESLHVCWEGAAATNCGRCVKCLRTMTCFSLVGALARCAAFDDAGQPPTADAVTALADRPSTVEHPEYVRQLLAHLPADDALARAWQRHLGEPDGPVIVAPPTTAVAGPSLRSRVEGALAATDQPAGDVGEVVVGWEDGMIPLRPVAAKRREVLAAVATNRRRSLGWVLVEPADPLVTNDFSASALADLADACWGPGICYLTGIGWAADQRPVIGPVAIARMLRAARIRLWWRAEGTLDPLRLIESLEHGCLPVQVMPGPEAELLRSRLPGALADLVLSGDDLASIDPRACDHLLDRAASWMLRGSAERDLGGMAAQWPSAGTRG